MAEIDPDLFNWLQALGSTLCAGAGEDSPTDLSARLGVVGLELTRVALEAEPDWEDQFDGFYSDSLRGLAELLAEELRAYPPDTVAAVCACISEGRTSDLWKVLA